ncbi:MAG TPA: HEAT repeat domain-containing protein [Phnomibacter sp.]|nr:HEAT repeat domain-containing protein [Phnomibacter sp.]
MNLQEIFSDKTIKAKGKVSTIGEWLISGQLTIAALIDFAEGQKPVNKAGCIEALEYATKKDPALASEPLLKFVTLALNDAEPRVKWESAKVIGNIAALLPQQISPCIAPLLKNAEHRGTVVRWATAYALAEILKLGTAANKKLLPAIEALCEKEEDGGVQKKYLAALKKVKGK